MLSSKYNQCSISWDIDRQLPHTRQVAAPSAFHRRSHLVLHYVVVHHAAVLMLGGKMMKNPAAVGPYWSQMACKKVVVNHTFSHRPPLWQYREER